MKTVKEVIRGHLSCVCHEIYKSRKMSDPECMLCQYESEIELMFEEYLSQFQQPTVSDEEINDECSALHLSGDMRKAYTAGAKYMRKKLTNKI